MADARPGTAAPADSGVGVCRVPPYGLMVCGGTMEIVSLQTTGSIRQGPNALPGQRS
jgi:hypothetical protein